MSRAQPREDLNDEVLNPRLQREKAKTGAITASLLWNGRSDLDLHAFYTSEATGRVHIFYSNKRAEGGVLDVDANAGTIVEEPVENIYWKEPKAGKYELQVNCFARRDAPGPLPFRLVLKLPEETWDYEASVTAGNQTITCFKYAVADDSSVTVEYSNSVDGLAEPAKIVRTANTADLTTCPVAKAKAKAVVAPKAKAKAAARVPKPTGAVAKASPMKVVKKKAMKIKALKPMKTMKAVKAIESKQGSVIAVGRGAKAEVFKGKKERTVGGLTKDKLVKNKAGRIVSKGLSEAAKKRMVATGLVEYWQAIKKARAELGLTGFVAIKKGTPLYKRAMEIYKPDA